jgi:16S rRNA pseudouridine516 synthase
MALMRLDKALQSQGFGTRKGCRALVEAGAVRVNGVTASDPDAEVDVAALEFTVGDVTWRFAERVVLALHKPAGTECSRTPTHHPSVFSLLPPHLADRGVQCVGRLDADTTGLLLLSDDGALIQRLTSPRRGVTKRYLVTCAAPVTDEQLAQLRQGVTLNDAPERVQGEAERAGERALRLTIGEGRYHQVKRMLAAAGNHVVTLHRERVGGLELPASLAPGAFTVLDAAARARLEESAP